MSYIKMFFEIIISLTDKLMSMLDSPARDIVTYIIVALLILPPIAITFINIIQFVKSLRGKNTKWKLLKLTDTYTIIGGTFLSALLYVMINFQDFHKAIIVGDFHAPVSSQHALTILFFAMLGTIGYFVLRCRKQLPPILFIGMLVFVYIEIGLCLFWIIQLSKNIFDLGSGSAFFIIFSVNYILLSVILIKNTVKLFTEELDAPYGNKFGSVY